MKSYLNTLTDRDKWMLIVGSLCTILYVYYVFLYTPLSNSVERKSTQFIEKTQTLEWMKSVQNQAHTTKGKQSITDNQLLSLVSSQLKEQKSLGFPFQLQQTGIGDIQLSFTEVPFNLFVSWLSVLNENYTIVIKQFNIEPTTTPGVVKLMIMLSGV